MRFTNKSSGISIELTEDWQCIGELLGTKMYAKMIGNNIIIGEEE